MDAPLNLGAAMRHIAALAVLVVLLPLAAAAQAPSRAEQDRAYDAAQVDYEVGHYAEAYAAFAALADAGHAEAARVALQMHRYGPGLYRMRFAAGPQQIGRWAALVSCRGQAAATAVACIAASGDTTESRR